MKTEINVILTCDRVYLTVDKVIHTCELYRSDSSDRYNDEAACICRSLGFSLASRSVNVWCRTVDISEKFIGKSEVFRFLDTGEWG